MRKLVLLLLLAGCSREPSPWEKIGVRVVDDVPQLDEVEITLARTECDGWCPAYTLKLSGGGTLTYTGKAYVKTKGEHMKSFDPRMLQSLLERFHELNFLTAKHQCTVRVFDNSHATVALRIGAQSNAERDEVADAYEAAGNMPAEDTLWHRRMFELEEAIDAAANVEVWIGTQAERQAHGREWR